MTSRTSPQILKETSVKARDIFHIWKKKSTNNSWNFVYIFDEKIRQFYFWKLMAKNSWNFVYIRDMQYAAQ